MPTSNLTYLICGLKSKIREPCYSDMQISQLFLSLILSNVNFLYWEPENLGITGHELFMLILFILDQLLHAMFLTYFFLVSVLKDFLQLW